MITLKRIFIAGHMGAGKSALGKALAEKLGWQYIEANPGLERYYGRHLDEIIGKQGAAAFHQCEAEIISLCIDKEHIVVALEEAVIATEKNRKLLSTEFVIYSKVTIPTQMQRMLIGQAPLLPVSDWKAFLEKQHAERDRFFEEVATITIEPTFFIEKDVNEVINVIETIASI